MRPIIAYLFLFIFSFQVIPVKEIGQILLKGQITEEEAHSSDDADDAPDFKLKKDSDPLHYTPQIEVARILYFSREMKTLLHHHSVYLPAFHVPDIFTPPPNCA